MGAVAGVDRRDRRHEVARGGVAGADRLAVDRGDVQPAADEVVGDGAARGELGVARLDHAQADLVVWLSFCRIATSRGSTTPASRSARAPGGSETLGLSSAACAFGLARRRRPRRRGAVGPPARRGAAAGRSARRGAGARRGVAGACGRGRAGAAGRRRAAALPRRCPPPPAASGSFGAGGRSTGASGSAATGRGRAAPRRRGAAAASSRRLRRPRPTRRRARRPRARPAPAAPAGRRGSARRPPRRGRSSRCGTTCLENS